MFEVAKKLVDICISKNLRIAVAESCTGGMLSSAITSVSGSSIVFDRGFITYSNESKIDLLDINTELLKDYGAVSPITASEMAIGAIKRSLADITVSITGIAGPNGGTPEKPIGLVYFATCTHDKTESHEKRFIGSRQEIRELATIFALELLLNIATSF
jgi:PncC family amidohydrolase